ncbi:MAG: glycosyltransferase family 61 protein, partial [Solirubrobacteraceae bacterium]
VTDVLHEALRRSGIAPSTATYMHTVDGFDQVPGAVIAPTDIVGEQPRFVSARTLQEIPYRYYDEVTRRKSPDRVIRAAAIPDGRLMHDGGVVVTRDGALVLESLWDVDHYERDYVTPKRVAPAYELEGTCASLISLWHNNYYHWMLDSLPRLAVLEAAGFDDVRLIVPEKMMIWQREMLARVGVAPERLTPYVGQHVQAEQLIWAAAPSYISVPTPFVVEWLRERLRGPAVEAAHRRLFIRRATNRRLINEAEVWEFLRQYGFEMIEPDKLSVAAQIEAFASARVVVATHGAGIANALFSDQISLLEMFQPGFFTAPYFALAGAAEWEYWYLTGIPSGTTGRSGNAKNSDFAVPIDLLGKTVQRMLATI